MYTHKYYSLQNNNLEINVFKLNNIKITWGPIHANNESIDWRSINLSQSIKP